MSAILNNRSIGMAVKIMAGYVYIPHIDDEGNLTWEVSTHVGDSPPPFSLLGSRVVANPSDEATGGELTKIKIDDVTYSVATKVESIPIDDIGGLN